MFVFFDGRSVSDLSFSCFIIVLWLYMPALIVSLFLCNVFKLFVHFCCNEASIAIVIFFPPTCCAVQRGSQDLSSCPPTFFPAASLQRLSRDVTFNFSQQL